MDTLDKKRVKSYFNRVLSKFPITEEICSVVITHLLPDRPYLLEAVNKAAEVISVIPKPKSICPTVKGWISHLYPIDQLSRSDIDKTDGFINLIRPRLKGRKVVLLDIGGYFSKSFKKIDHALDNCILGVIEDTENGLQKYTSSVISKPVISVARSPLKNPEDFLVGQSIVFSTEALLREQGDILHGRTACVIGYGKLGRSIAELLNARHVRTVVYDIDPIKSVEAMSHGFTVSPSLSHALKGSGIIFCATGNFAVKAEDFENIDDGAYIATVTSSDDELQLQEIKEKYTINMITDYIAQYRNKQHVVYVLNRGQAINFIHGAAVGPFIYLIQAEILASISILLNNNVKLEIIENNKDMRCKIASIWLQEFGPKSYRKHKYD